MTFLFTDIESSTQRWQDDRDAMAAALAEHDALLAARGPLMEPRELQQFTHEVLGERLEPT